jgi:hypothetical protein
VTITGVCLKKTASRNCLKWFLVHDLIDVMVAESRKNDEFIDWEKDKDELRSASKL